MQSRRSLAVLVTLALLGCGLVSFDVDQDIPAQTIPGSPLAAVLPAGASLFQLPLNIDINAATQGHGTGPARSANLKSLTLTVTAPSAAPGNNFDFLDSIQIIISASGQSDQEIAQLSPVSKGQTTISITPDPGVDLLPYINAGATIKVTASGHEPAQDTTVVGHVVVTVHV
jgi:hypothetical protein